MSTLRLRDANAGGVLLLAVLVGGLAWSLGLFAGAAGDPARWRLSAGQLAADLGLSLARTSLACLVAWSTGVGLGYLLWARPRLERLTAPAVNFVRAISPFAWLPLAVVWFGLGEAPVAFVLLVALLPPCLVAARDAFAQVDRDYVDEARVLGAEGTHLFGGVMLPLALPALLTLLRVAWALGWGTVVAAEMLGVDRGLGFRLLDFRFLVQYGPMLVYLVVMGLVGVVVDHGLRAVAAAVARRRGGGAT
jgi:ABC-type nitrate/sulfonate/bicarbonate transport system permease component